MIYDADYFERGIQTGKSGYENYRWIPELTIPLAYEMIKSLNIQHCDKILDFGCAKGYLVRAFRLLHHKAWGVDISRYALSQAPYEIKKYLRELGGPPVFELDNYLRNNDFDWIIAKDVFEHMDEDYLEIILEAMNRSVENMYVIVPLGKDGVYNAPANNLDPSHKICENTDWWISRFNRSGYEVTYYRTQMDFMKQAYKNFPNAHGFFNLKAI